MIIPACKDITATSQVVLSHSENHCLIPSSASLIHALIYTTSRPTVNKCDMLRPHSRCSTSRRLSRPSGEAIIISNKPQRNCLDSTITNMIVVFIFICYPYLVACRPDGTVDIGNNTVGLIFATSNSGIVAFSQTMWTILSAILGWLLGTGLLLTCASLVVITAHRARAGHYAVIVAGAISSAGIVGQVRLLKSLQAKGAVVVVAIFLVVVPYAGIMGTALLASKPGTAVRKDLLPPFTNPEKKWTALDQAKADADLYALTDEQNQQYNLDLVGYGLRVGSNVVKVTLEVKPGNSEIYSQCGNFLMHFRDNGKKVPDVAEKVNDRWVAAGNNQTTGPWATTLDAIKSWIGIERYNEIRQIRGVISHVNVTLANGSKSKVAIYGTLFSWQDVRDILGYKVLKQFPMGNDYFYLYGDICYHNESIVSEQPKVKAWYKLYDATSLPLPELIDDMIIQKMYSAGHVGQALGVMWTLNSTEKVLNLQREYAKRLSHRLIPGLPGPVVWRVSNEPVVVVTTFGLITLIVCAVMSFILGAIMRYIAGKKAECRPVLSAADMAARALAPNTVSCAGAMSLQSVPSSRRNKVKTLPENHWPLKVTDQWAGDNSSATLLHVAAWHENLRSSMELANVDAKRCGLHGMHV
ncbi:hypothetical protein K7432_011006 [Basidiobolus ranarum]|uniref:Uncharacterized protein n=1 Tax=Basidiobolus ranarum TaxID=34480 RepID=A0ABR2VUL4_9FUNG